MNYELTAQQKQLQENTARFCAQEIAPFAGKLERSTSLEKQSLIKKNMEKLGEAGLLAAGHGEDDLDLIAIYLAGQEIARSCPATFVTSRASTFLCAGLIRLFGSSEQKQSYLPGLMNGELTGALACTEEQAGTDLAGITSTAHNIQSGWTVTGCKNMVINAPVADILVVLAQNIEAADNPSSASLFIIVKNAEGLSIGSPLETLGLRGCSIAPLSMNRCPAELLGSRPGDGIEQVRHIMSIGSIGIAALAVGIGTSCMELSTAYAKSRKVSGRSIGMYQDVGFRLADMFAYNDLGRMLALRAAWGFNTGDREAPVLASCAKLFAAESASKIAGWAIGIFAGHGYLAGSDIERLYRDAKFCEICEGTSATQRAHIAGNELDRFASM